MKAKTIGFVLALITPLVLASVVIAFTPASPVETSGSAAVGVNEYISFTVTDFGTAGTSFGNLNPGTANQPASDAPAVNLTVAKETNVDLNISLKGNNFTASYTLFVGNVKYDDDSNITDDTGNLPIANLATNYPASWWSLSNPTTDQSKAVWFWISIPTEQPAGDYTSTFYFRAAKQA